MYFALYIRSIMEKKYASLDVIERITQFGSALDIALNKHEVHDAMRALARTEFARLQKERAAGPKPTPPPPPPPPPDTDPGGEAEAAPELTNEQLATYAKDYYAVAMFERRIVDPAQEKKSIAKCRNDAGRAVNKGRGPSQMLIELVQAIQVEGYEGFPLKDINQRKLSTLELIGKQGSDSDMEVDDEVKRLLESVRTAESGVTAYIMDKVKRIRSIITPERLRPLSVDEQRDTFFVVSILLQKLQSEMRQRAVDATDVINEFMNRMHGYLVQEASADNPQLVNSLTGFAKMIRAEVQRGGLRTTLSQDSTPGDIIRASLEDMSKTAEPMMSNHHISSVAASLCQEFNECERSKLAPDLLQAHIRDPRFFRFAQKRKDSDTFHVLTLDSIACDRSNIATINPNDKTANRRVHFNEYAQLFGRIKTAFTPPSLSNQLEQDRDAIRRYTPLLYKECFTQLDVLSEEALQRRGLFQYCIQDETGFHIITSIDPATVEELTGAIKNDPAVS